VKLGADTIEMIKKLKNLFLEHPRAVGETYLQHMSCSLRFGVRLIAAGAACFVHAIFPFAFKTTASSVAEKIVNTNKSRRSKDES
tara:strand:- start:158 stop:412 length:255 start_codon:yes stop_codon:yes gene_type:complete